LAVQLSQNEIDALMQQYFEPDVKDLQTVDIGLVQKSHTMRSMLNRLTFARENGDYRDIKYARHGYHVAAFDLWLAVHGFDRDSYVTFVNRQFEKRGMKTRIRKSYQ